VVQSHLTDDNRERARNNIDAIGRNDLESLGILRYTIDQSEDISEEQAAIVRKALRIEDPPPTRIVHVRQTVVERHDHFVYLRQTTTNVRNLSQTQLIQNPTYNFERNVYIRNLRSQQVLQHHSFQLGRRQFEPPLLE
jgi:hypothetical protein